MQTGKHKDNYYAACFVLHKQPKRDPDNRTEILMVDGKPAGLEFVPRKPEVCYWGKTADGAMKGLLKTIKDKDYKIDDRRKNEECGVTTSVKKFAKHYKDQAELKKKREDAEAARKVEADAHAKKIADAKRGSVE